jgi:hypothetical protein
MSAMERLSRRNVLQGMLGGAAITVGLPILECHLTGNGDALAATGQSLPPCFGTWFWGLGLSQGHWEPKEIGDKYVMRDHLKCLAPVKDKINIYSGMQIFLDGKINQNHYSGAQGQATGMVSKTGSEYSTSIDTMVGDFIGRGTRFKSLEAGMDGDRKSSWSARGQNGLNPAEISPVGMYTRIFGSSFVDPNAANFTPDPNTMVRHSVLSAVSDYRDSLMKEVSAADKQRLDEYFTSVRDLEQKLAVELEKPMALPGCKVPDSFSEEDVGSLVDQARQNHRLFARLMTNALSCGQTRIFNLSMGQGLGSLRKAGEILTYHSLTHEEAVDPKLGYQVKCHEIAESLMDSFRELVVQLDSIKEGDKTLLDRTLVFAFTDHGEARVHSMQKYPILTAGSGGGRMKTGMHINAEGDTATRVGFTMMRALGMPLGSWGTESNQTSKAFTELLVQA